MSGGAKRLVGVTVLGSTGSIGISTLRVLSEHRDRFSVFALSANRDVDGMLKQCMAARPARVAMADEDAAQRLSERLLDRGLDDIDVGAGPQAVESLAADSGGELVMAAIVGAAGLLPTLAAAHAGKRVLLANKEALVVAGALLIDAVRQSGGLLLPIDSEHNAVFQCLPAGGSSASPVAGDCVERILLTASGGPFRNRSYEEMVCASPAEACDHPNWSMGRKISVDSATMMNKGLELIEACWLFAVPPERIEVVVHPQSVIHSMVAYRDGSVLAQLGNPDMRTPIAHALAWPDRIAAGVEPLDLFRIARLDFERPDEQRFPCLRLARCAAELGGTVCASLNAANEVAVAAFLDGRLAFTDISCVIEHTLERCAARPVENLDVALSADAESRRIAESRVKTLCREAV